MGETAEGTAAEVTGEDTPAAAQYALVEQMGHRRYVGTIREAVLAGRQMLEVDRIDGSGPILIGPETIYALTPMTEQQARRYAGLASPPAIGSGSWAGTGYGDDLDDEYGDQAEELDDDTDNTIPDTEGSD